MSTRKLGFIPTLAIALGTTIGAGVFALTGTAARHTGTGLPWAFLLGVLPVLFALVPIAMLAGAIPTAGGSYKYASRLISPGMGFMTVWLFALGTFLGAFPLYAHTCIEYINELTGFGLPRGLSAAALLTVFYLVNLRGVSLAAFVEAGLVILLVCALLAYAGFGVSHVEPREATGTGAGIAIGAGLLTFAYMGGNALIEMGHEIHRPGLYIPLAMGVSLVIVLVLYLVIGIVTVGVGAPADENLAVVAETFLSRPAYVFFIVGGAVTALCTTINAYFMWGTKSIQVLCEDKVLPAGWGTNHAKWGTPAKILTGVWGLSCVGAILPISEDALSAFASMSGMVVLIPVLISSMFLPRKCPQRYAESRVKLPGVLVIVAPAIGVLICLSALVSVVPLLWAEPWTLGLLVLWTAAGAVYWFARKGRLEIEPEPGWT